MPKPSIGAAFQVNWCEKLPTRFHEDPDKLDSMNREPWISESCPSRYSAVNRYFQDSLVLAELQLHKAMPIVSAGRPTVRLQDNRSKPAIDVHGGGVVTIGWSLVQRLRISHDPIQAQP